MKTCYKITLTSSRDIFIDFHTRRCKHLFCGSLYAKQRCLRRRSTRSYLFHNNDTASSEMERKHGSGKIAFTEQIIRK